MKTSTKKLEHIDPQRLASNPRAQLAAWNKYKDLVIQAIRQHPRPYIYRPSNMTPQSVCSKVRDAIRGCLAFGYDKDEISHFDMERWWSEVIVKHDLEHVYIGPPEAVHQSLSGTIVSENGEFNYPTLSFEEIAAFQILISTGRIKSHVVVMQPPDLTLLPKRSNVELITRPDGSLVML